VNNGNNLSRSNPLEMVSPDLWPRDPIICYLIWWPARQMKTSI